MTSDLVFDAYSVYYDIFYHDKDYANEVEYIVELLKDQGFSGSNLLEFGSGTGKHGILLAEKGYSITGIERSEKMVKRAIQSDGFTCQKGDIRTVNLNSTFDAVLALFHVISYQTTNSDIKSVFQNAAQHLEKGGLFLFDVWYSPAVYNLRPERRELYLEKDNLEIKRIAEPTIFSNENRVDVNYTITVRDTVNDKSQTFTEKHQMRHFSIPEIDFFAQTEGFKLVKAEGFLSGEQPSENTWGVCFALKKE
jgi:SAM-dependent methyltransferase